MRSQPELRISHSRPSLSNPFLVSVRVLMMELSTESFKFCFQLREELGLAH